MSAACSNTDDRIGIKNMSSMEQVTITVQKLEELTLSPKLLDQFIFNMNRYGVCLINLKNYDPKLVNSADKLKSDLLTLRQLFGDVSFHQKSDPMTGILTIDPRNPNSINVANTHLVHQPHTDDAYLSNPAGILAMGCHHHSQNGGDTFLICGQSMLDDILPKVTKKEKDALFEPDAIEIGRKLPNNLKNGMEYKLIQNPRPILSYYKGDDGKNDNKNIRLIYRHRDLYVKKVRNDAENAWKLMTKYCDKEENRFQFKLKSGQIMIIDNTSLIHGRTPYNKSDLRVLYRLNLFNNGSLSNRIKLGMKINSKL